MNAPRHAAPAGSRPQGFDPYSAEWRDAAVSGRQWQDDGDIVTALDCAPDDETLFSGPVPTFTPHEEPRVRGEALAKLEAAFPAPARDRSQDIIVARTDLGAMGHALSGLRNLDVPAEAGSQGSHAPVRLPADDGGWLKALLAEALHGHAGRLLCTATVCEDCKRRRGGWCERHAWLQSRAEACARAGAIVEESGSSLLAVLALLDTEWRTV